MNYWLDLFTPYTWTRFRDHGATISGFRPRQRRTAYERIKPGNYLLCYLVKLSRWSGVLEVVSEAFEDSAPIFSDENDPFSIRFQVKPIVLLDFEYALPIEEPALWSNLSFTKSLIVGSVGWAQRAKMRQSLLQIGADDGAVLTKGLVEQGSVKKKYELDVADQRHITHRTVVRTESGEVEVEVPEREELSQFIADEAPIEVRDSIKVQAKVAQLGAALGFTIWVPSSDRVRILEIIPQEYRDKFVAILPLNYDLATMKTIENIDVIWLQRRAIMRAFEIEHTTAIYSGLLRMADLLAMRSIMPWLKAASGPPTGCATRPPTWPPKPEAPV